MKPIEPGCLALHIGEISGVTEVRCLRRADDEEVRDAVRTERGGNFNLLGSNYWLLDRPVLWKSKYRRSGKIVVYQLPFGSERKLFRIDGHEEPTTTERAVEA